VKIFISLVGLLWPTEVTSFPVTSLSISQSTFIKLNSTTTGNDRLATQTLLPALQSVFKDVKYAIEIETGDIVIPAQFPDTQVDGDCHHKIEAEHPKATGRIKKSSFLRFGVANVSWHGATVFADTELDTQLDICTDVCVRVGENIFGHHCSQIARKTVGIDVLSDGQTGVGLELTASNASIAKVNGIWSLVFNFHASVVGTVLHWNVDKVTADNCKIKILGIEIASVCGTIESHVKSKVQTLTNQVMTITVPNILKRLEDKVNTKIGDSVVIPLKIGGPEPDMIIV